MQNPSNRAGSPVGSPAASVDHSFDMDQQAQLIPEWNAASAGSPAARVDHGFGMDLQSALIRERRNRDASVDLEEGNEQSFSDVASEDEALVGFHSDQIPAPEKGSVGTSITLTLVVFTGVAAFWVVFAYTVDSFNDEAGKTFHGVPHYLGDYDTCYSDYEGQGVVEPDLTDSAKQCAQGLWEEYINGALLKDSLIFSEVIFALICFTIIGIAGGLLGGHLKGYIDWLRPFSWDAKKQASEERANQQGLHNVGHSVIPEGNLQETHYIYGFWPNLAKGTTKENEWEYQLLFGIHDRAIAMVGPSRAYAILACLLIEPMLAFAVGKYFAAVTKGIYEDCFDDRMNVLKNEGYCGTTYSSWNQCKATASNQAVTCALYDEIDMRDEEFYKMVALLPVLIPAAALLAVIIPWAYSELSKMKSVAAPAPAAALDVSAVEAGRRSSGESATPVNPSQMEEDGCNVLSGSHAGFYAVERRSDESDEALLTERLLPQQATPKKQGCTIC